MSFAKYPATKDSGVAWLGEVPGHWEIKRLRYLVDCLDEKRVPLNSAQRADRPGDVPYWGANAIMGYVDEPLLDEELVLLGEDGAPFFDPFRPVAFRSVGPVWPNNHIHVLRPKQTTTTKFIVYCLNVTDYANFIEGSTRDKLTQAGMNSISLPWPSHDEAITIATFLDHETAKIDALVAEQEKLIALLQEKRQAVISHAVTKGLNPHAPMKDSGVEWLGEVPEHWVVQPLKYAVKFHSGGTPDKSNRDYWDGEIPWASAKDLKVDDLFDTADHITQQALDDGAAALIGVGSVLVVVRGMILARTFPVVTARAPMAINQDLKAVVANDHIQEEFLPWLLRGTASETLDRLDEAGHGTKALRMDAWANMQLPFPVLAEQADIATHLRNETTKLDALVTQVRTAITLLQERRTALISAAVTGQIDVRGWANPA